jgi:hypothetical protein
MENLPAPIISWKLRDLGTMLRELRQIEEDMQDPEKWAGAGICNHVSEKDLLRSLFPMWPLYSGAPYFPVPVEDGNPCSAYITAGAEELWNREKSRYAALRWELLEFLIDTLEQEIDRRCEHGN